MTTTTVIPVKEIVSSDGAFVANLSPRGGIYFVSDRQRKDKVAYVTKLGEMCGDGFDARIDRFLKFLHTQLQRQ